MKTNTSTTRTSTPRSGIGALQKIDEYLHARRSAWKEGRAQSTLRHGMQMGEAGLAARRNATGARGPPASRLGSKIETRRPHLESPPRQRAQTHLQLAASAGVAGDQLQTRGAGGSPRKCAICDGSGGARVRAPKRPSRARQQAALPDASEAGWKPRRVQTVGVLASARPVIPHSSQRAARGSGRANGLVSCARGKG